MTIDLHRAMYSHCDHDADTLPAHLVALLDSAVADLVGAPIRQTRITSYFQGAVTLLNEHAEFRVHVWFDLPHGHPDFPGADRGLACLLRPVGRDGLHGPTMGGVGWLGRPLSLADRLSGDDWVSEMVREQGYLDVPGSEWLGLAEGTTEKVLLGSILGYHLQGMINHVILEERLYGRVG